LFNNMMTSNNKPNLKHTESINDKPNTISMKTIESYFKSNKLILGVALLLAAGFAEAAPMGTAFTYEGRLTYNGNPAEGLFDFTFSVFDAPEAGTDLSGRPASADAVSVSNGVFSVTLDFGGDVFNSEARFLEIGVRPNGSADPYTILAPRQELTPTPYALHAANAFSASSVPAGSIEAGNLAPDVGVWTKAGSDLFYTEGNVGIGTTTPGTALALERNGEALRLQSDRVGGRVYMNYYADGVSDEGQIQSAWVGFATEGLNSFSIDNRRTQGNIDFWPGEGGLVRAMRGLSVAGNVTLTGGGQYISCDDRLHIQSDENLYLNPFAPGGDVYVGGGGGIRRNLFVTGNVTLTGGGQYISCDDRLHIQSAANDYIYLNPFQGDVSVGSGNHAASLSVAGDLVVDGTTTTKVLTITGGSDLSENFDIAAAEGALKPGMLACIDPFNPGKLVLSSRACDRTVAGIISGAGGIETGMRMGQASSLAAGKHPVALTGRVYAYADAAHGPIQPGDLLTTSDTPGHAMRVTDYGSAQGAIIGKAMTGLSEGKGLVLVLVSLQ